MERLKSGLAVAVGVSPFCIAALYLVGSAYSDTFIEALGLSRAQFPTPFETVVLQGFLALVAMGLRPFIYLFIGLGVVNFAIVGAVELLRHRRGKRYKRARDVGGDNAQPHPSNELGAINSFADRLMSGLIITATTLGIVFSLIVASVAAGESAANKFHRKVMDGDKPISSVYLKGAGEASVKGVLVACNSSQCAYWVSNQSVILNLSDVDRVDSFPAQKR